MLMKLFTNLKGSMPRSTQHMTNMCSHITWAIAKKVSWFSTFFHLIYTCRLQTFSFVIFSVNSWYFAGHGLLGFLLFQNKFNFRELNAYPWKDDYDSGTYALLSYLINRFWVYKFSAFLSLFSNFLILVT